MRIRFVMNGRGHVIGDVVDLPDETALDIMYDGYAVDAQTPEPKPIMPLPAPKPKVKGKG